MHGGVYVVVRRPTSGNSGATGVERPLPQRSPANWSTFVLWTSVRCALAPTGPARMRNRIARSTPSRGSPSLGRHLLRRALAEGKGPPSPSYCPRCLRDDDHVDKEKKPSLYDSARRGTGGG